MINLNKDKSSIGCERNNFIDLIATLNDGITSSKHILTHGDISPYFIDFDLITNDAKNCEIVSNAFTNYIKSIKRSAKHPPNFLGFIEKDGIGTTGAIRFAADLTIQTGIPNLTIRQWKDVPCERIKVSLDVCDNPTEGKDRLWRKNVLLVSDVSTSGTELLKAIKEIRNVGGNVHDIILYYSRLSKLKIEEFLRNNINIYPLILPSHARYVAYNTLMEESKINRMKAIFLVADENLSKNNLLVGDSPIISIVSTKPLKEQLSC